MGKKVRVAFDMGAVGVYDLVRGRGRWKRWKVSGTRASHPKNTACRTLPRPPNNTPKKNQQTTRELIVRRLGDARSADLDYRRACADLDRLCRAVVIDDAPPAKLQELKAGVLDAAAALHTDLSRLHLGRDLDEMLAHEDLSPRRGVLTNLQWGVACRNFYDGHEVLKERGHGRPMTTFLFGEAGLEARDKKRVAAIRESLDKNGRRAATKQRVA